MGASHSTVAHAWANQTGRNKAGFNMFYDGGTIFSYGRHFPIARILQDSEAARPTILFTSKGHSSSTSKHKCYTSRAIDHHTYRVFVVENVMAHTPREHLANWEGSIEDARESLGKAKRARKNASYYLDDATRAINRCNDYSETFGLGMATVTMESLDAAAADIAVRAEAMRRDEEIARVKREREAVLRHRAALRQWLHGAKIYPPYTKVPYVRVKDDAVETTHGAKVPLRDALEAYGKMKQARETHETRTFEHAFDKDVPGSLHVGDFSVSSISPTGMRVGCHFIPFKVAKMAAEIAGIETPPAVVKDLGRWADDGGRVQ